MPRRITEQEENAAHELHSKCIPFFVQSTPEVGEGALIKLIYAFIAGWHKLFPNTDPRAHAEHILMEVQLYIDRHPIK